MKLEEIQKEMLKHEKIIYLDECAAGVLCFDLFIGAIVISAENLNNVSEVNDSKKLTEKKRAELFPKIIESSTDYEIVRIKPQEVDSLNIYQARMEGFRRAIEILQKRTGATLAIIDGNKVPSNTVIQTECLIKGDALIPGISCASILAKHSHTVEIYKLCENELYSKYGLENHKGYGTKIHLEALKKYGPIEGFHRYSYKPVKESVR